MCAGCVELGNRSDMFFVAATSAVSQSLRRPLEAVTKGSAHISAGRLQSAGRLHPMEGGEIRRLSPKQLSKRFDHFSPGDHRRNDAELYAHAFILARHLTTECRSSAGIHPIPVYSCQSSFRVYVSLSVCDESLNVLRLHTPLPVTQ